MAHLSAESALYCRIFTEGILGIVPTGFNSFELTPNIPDEWEFFNLKRIRAFDSKFDLIINRKGDKLLVQVIQFGKVVFTEKVKNGQTIRVSLEN
jgi:cellobiose phosphorylase